MKSTELFDLLGEIDDKFYIEARIPDEQHGVEVVSEHRPIRGFMSIFLPIAACVAIIAAVVVGANFVKRNAGILPPNYPDSDLSSDAPFTSDMIVSSYDTSNSTSSEDSSVPVQDNGEIRLEDYPPIDFETVPDIKGGGLQSQIEHQDEKLQKATLATLKCGDYELHMLGRFIHIDKSDQDELYSSKLYSYYVTLALSKNGKVISDDGTHTRSVSMGQGGYVLDAEQLSAYLEYYEFNGAPLIIFKYPGELGPDASIGFEATFFSIVDDKLVPLMGDYNAVSEVELDMSAELTPSYKVDKNSASLTDGDLIYRFNCENFGKNPYDNAPHYTVSVVTRDWGDELDLSDYPPLDMSQIPEVGEDIYNLDLALPRATLAEKQVGEYTLSIIGENLRSSLIFQKDDNPQFMVENICSVISRDGNIIRTVEESGTGVRTNMLSEDEIDHLFPDTYEMADGIVFGLWRKSVQPYGEPIFGMIKDDVMFEFESPLIGIDERDPNDGTVGMVPPADESVVLIAEGNALILDNIRKYVFDFDNVTYSETIIEPIDLVGKEIDLSEYVPFDGNELKNVQSKVLIDAKDFGEYNFYLLGVNVKNYPSEEFPSVGYGKLFIAVEKNGKIVAQMDAETAEYINGSALSEYLQPFKMKDGMGFVMYYIIDPWSGSFDHQAMLYKIENDTVTKLRYEYDFAPAPATGSPFYVGSDFKVVPESNTIVHDKGTLTIDFANNTFSMS